MLITYTMAAAVPPPFMQPCQYVHFKATTQPVSDTVNHAVRSLLSHIGAGRKCMYYFRQLWTTDPVIVKPCIHTGYTDRTAQRSFSATGRDIRAGWDRMVQQVRAAKDVFGVRTASDVCTRDVVEKGMDGCLYVDYLRLNDAMAVLRMTVQWVHVMVRYMRVDEKCLRGGLSMAGNVKVLESGSWDEWMRLSGSGDGNGKGCAMMVSEETYERLLDVCHRFACEFYLFLRYWWSVRRTDMLTGLMQRAESTDDRFAECLGYKVKCGERPSYGDGMDMFGPVMAPTYFYG